MRYRDHRGSLKASLATIQEVFSVDEIITHLNKTYKGRDVKEIKFEYIGFDKRINWNTYYVLQRISGEKDFTVAGMSDGCFN